MKNLPIGIQTFKDIINGNYIYIDKTIYIYQMIKTPKGVYFLSRPRRFGKSLLISTLNEIFLGNKELFKGLWIYNSDYKWEKYPVIRLDFSKLMARTSEQLEELIIDSIDNIAEEYNIKLTRRIYTSRLDELIRNMVKKYNKQVVVLIDEYDKPIIDHIDDTKTAVDMRDVLKAFYTILKGDDEYIRFVLLTGVSKLTHSTNYV